MRKAILVGLVTQAILKRHFGTNGLFVLAVNPFSPAIPGGYGAPTYNTPYGKTTDSRVLQEMDHDERYHTKLKPYEKFDHSKYLKNYNNPRYTGQVPVQEKGIFSKVASGAKAVGRYLLGGTSYRDKVNPHGHTHGPSSAGYHGHGVSPYGSGIGYGGYGHHGMGHPGIIGGTNPGMIGGTHPGIIGGTHSGIIGGAHPGVAMAGASAAAAAGIGGIGGIGGAMPGAIGGVGGVGVPGGVGVGGAGIPGDVGVGGMGVPGGYGASASASAGIMGDGYGPSASASASAGYGSLSSEGLRDGISAANVLGSYYDVLVGLKKPIQGISPITGILAYPISDNLYTDYWGIIKFHPNSQGLLTDKSGYFYGERVNSRKDIMRHGSLSEIGFYQKRGLTENEMNNNYIAVKMLIQEISNITKKDIETLHNEKIGVGFLQGIQEYYGNIQNRLKNRKTCLTICICSNSSCTGPCKSIKCVEPMYLI
ncbi:hypothetical protein NEHOM01_1824 [Nematocida homosporus]|uniref:uncharacterized protein n=1 Tax=Nematocida homosporus TaxID=1912981 RepID=UPI00221F765F|nr:uncharacterized protein NEHOM01_1824 [Nematocida homosporus]KAI5186958.1 hypothetical protein NEHOM01_1824 [Nematocida homosporus]